MNKTRPQQSNKQFFLKYASLGTQLLAAIGLAVFAGLEADKWLRTSPLFACVLPLLVLSLLFYRIFRETEKPSKNE